MSQRDYVPYTEEFFITGAPHDSRNASHQRQPPWTIPHATLTADTIGYRQLPSTRQNRWKPGAV